MSEQEFAEAERQRLLTEQKVTESKKPISPFKLPNVESLLIDRTLTSGKGTLVLTDVNMLNDVLRETMEWYNNEISKVREKLTVVVEDAQRNYKTVEGYVDAINDSNQSVTAMFQRILDAIEKSHPNDDLEREVLMQIKKEL
jgi:hypothetical protein